MKFMYGLNHSPDDPPPGGQTPVQTPAPTTQEPALSDDVMNAFRSLVNKQGGLDAAGMLLFQENYSLREERRENRQRIERLEKQVPKDGHVVLSPEQRQQWERYQQLGSPEEIEQTKTQLMTLERTSVIQEAAATVGYKPSVLSALPGSDKLTFEVRQDGDNKVAFVKGEDGTEKPLADYAQEHWADFVPSLVASQAAPGQRPGINYVPQTTAGGQAKGIADQYLESQAAREKDRKNPLQVSK